MTLDLFDYTPPQTAPYVRSSDTSREAAEAIAPSLSRLEQVVFSALDKAGDRGLTCQEAERVTGLEHTTVSARFRGLELAQRIIKTDDRRLTKSGRKAVVYKTAGRAA